MILNGVLLLQLLRFVCCEWSDKEYELFENGLVNLADQFMPFDMDGLDLEEHSEEVIQGILNI